jgi:O-antigen/teichoic acid export membrane protein
VSHARDPFENDVRRGIWVNAIGLIVRAVSGAWLPLITWLYGLQIMGGYWLALPFEELGIAICSSGLSDATTILGSRFAETAKTSETERRHFFAIVSSALWISSIGGLVVGFILFAASRLMPLLPSRYQSVAAVLPWFGLSVATTAYTNIVIGALRAKLRYTSEPLLNGIVRPLLLIVIAVLVGQKPSLSALAFAVGMSSLGTAIIATVLLVREFSANVLSPHSVSRAACHELASFALPQTMNLTLNRYISRLDVLFLSSNGLEPAALARYGTACWLTSQLRAIRMTLSSALAPVAARHHASLACHLLTETLTTLLHRSLALTLAVIFPIIVLRNDILSLAVGERMEAPLYVFLLLAQAGVGTGFGLAGNALVFTGHTRWTLLNSAAVAAINTILILPLVTAFGCTGAAAASLLATTIITFAQAVELRYLEAIAIPLLRIKGPLLAAVPVAISLALTWDPAKIHSVATRVGMSFGLLALYTCALWIIEKKAIRPLLQRTRTTRSRSIEAVDAP